MYRLYSDSKKFHFLTPLKITMLAINAVCFGGCVVLSILGHTSGPLILLTIGTGLSLFAGLAGAIIASRNMQHSPDPGFNKQE